MQDLVELPAGDPAIFAEAQRQERRRINFVIVFTPRSGSTWLGDILRSAGNLGHAREFLNPPRLAKMMPPTGAANLKDYLSVLPQVHGLGPSFSMKVTMPQVMRALGEDLPLFFSIMPKGTVHFWLRRRDVLAQALSMDRAVSSGLFHSVTSKVPRIALAAQNYRPDPESILDWVDRLVHQERQAFRFFKDGPANPFQMTYEDIIADGAVKTVEAIMRRVLPVDLCKPFRLGPGLTKLTGEREDAWREDLRTTHADRLAEAEAKRPPFAKAYVPFRPNQPVPVPGA